ncbi:MAG: cytochrome c1 [Legionella sp.]|nr:cytochrome c1 [Legionella sp.]
MRVIIGILFIVTLNHAVWARVSGHQDHSSASIQRGAKLFINYCSGCHSLNYLTYNRLATDAGIVNTQGRIDKKMLQNLMFNTTKVQSPIHANLTAGDAKKWFGISPPDLSLIALIRDKTWIYNYLNSFYQDETQPFGVNNRQYPGTLMPHVLEPLFGLYELSQEKSAPTMQIRIHPGSLSASEQKRFLDDLLRFLSYVAEPEKKTRMRIGIFVVIYFLTLFLILFKLKQIIWRKITAKK